MTDLSEQDVESAVKVFVREWDENYNLFFNAQENFQSVFELFLAATKEPELYNACLNWSEAHVQVKKIGVRLSSDAFGHFYSQVIEEDIKEDVFEDVSQEELDFIGKVFNRLAHPIDFTKHKLEDYL